MSLAITPFFDPATFSFSYVVSEPSGAAAIIDTVLDFDPVSGRATTANADKILSFVQEHRLQVEWLLETHIHADHLSAAQYLKEQLGGTIAVGAGVTQVQHAFSRVFNAAQDCPADGSQFDRLLHEGDELALGASAIKVLATPGHTPACITYVIENNAFVGDTLFMPDYGTARTDFPGGDADQLYASIQKILALPDDTNLYMCHDYGTATRTQFNCLTTVALQRTENIHIHENIDQAKFVEFRTCRDRDLAAPRLLYPAVQFNMRAGAFASPEDNGETYIKIPVRYA